LANALAIVAQGRAAPEHHAFALSLWHGCGQYSDQTCDWPHDEILKFKCAAPTE